MRGLIRGRNVGLTVAAAVAVLGVFVSTGAGSPSTSRTLQRSTVGFAAHRISKAQAIGGSAYKTQITTSGSYVHVVFGPFGLAASSAVGGTVHCPADYPHPISGIFKSNEPLVFASDSFPENGGWHTRLTNVGDAHAEVHLGVVCST